MLNFKGNKDLCKLTKEYLNASLCKCVVYSLRHSKTSDVSHVFLPLTVAELSTLKQVRFFGPPCRYAKIHQIQPIIFLKLDLPKMAGCCSNQYSVLPDLSTVR